MPYGTSLGTSHEDEISYVLDNGLTAKQKADQAEMKSNATSGDFQSRFYATDASTMPSGASTELTGALKSYGGTQTPENVPVTRNLGQEALSTIAKAYEWKQQFNEGKLDWQQLDAPKSERDSSKDLKVNPWVTITPEDIDKGIDVGLAAGPGTMAGVKSISNLKPAERGAKLTDLGHAQVLEAAGEHPDVVHQETGFFRGADSRWRYEINDSKSVFDKDWMSNPEINIPKWNKIDSKWEDTAKLSDVLDHPELYKAYPHLKDVRVKYDPDYKGIAEYSNSNTITMGEKAFSEHDPKGILMHEVQHAIQTEEGFAKGGSSGKAGVNFELKYQKAVENLIPEYVRLKRKMNAGTDGLVTPQEEARYMYLKQVADTYNKYSAAGDQEAFINYKKLAGETESRNVETRLLMDEAARRRVPPRFTEDYNPRDQIVSDKPVLTTAYTGKKR